MLFLDEFRWLFCQPAALALALLCGSAGSPSWASNSEFPRPCTSQSSSQSSSQRAGANGGHSIINRSASESIGESIGEREDTSAGPPRAEPPERNRAAKKGVVADLCLAYFAQNLVSDQKTIWTSPLHLHALHSTDRNWLLPLGVGTIGLIAADQDIMRPF